MNKLLTILFLLITTPCFATTWYVRTDGGTATQCTGLADAAYDGSGTRESCAFNHPSWAMGSTGTSTIMVAGDTLIIDGETHGETTSSGRAEYKIGYGMPNTSGCSLWYPYSCSLDTPVSGTSTSNKTKIYGKGYDSGCATKPQLWGTEDVYAVLPMMDKSYLDIQCIEITDHEDCGYGVGPDKCPQNWGTGTSSGSYGKIGIQTEDSVDVSLTNIDIHGMALTGFFGARMTDWTFDHVNIDGNYFAGYDGDISGNDFNVGTITFNNVNVRWNGCKEAYPRAGTTADYTDCCEQNQACYGDGMGTGFTGGSWVYNDCDVSHNTQDGLDMLYHNNNGIITVRRSRFEGNAGNQVKVGTTTKIENSKIIGNCTYFTDSGKASTGWAGDCRAGGDSLVMDYGTGDDLEFYNSTIAGSVGNYLIYYSNNNYLTVPCSGTETLILKNDIFGGGTNWQTPGLFVSFLSGEHCSPTITQNNNGYDYNNLNNSYCSAGATTKFCGDPMFDGPLSGDSYNVNIQSGSPARDLADETVSVINSLDFNNFDRGSYWDIGALEYGSVSSGGDCTENGAECSVNGDCCGGYCCEYGCSSVACFSAATPMLNGYLHGRLGL